MEAVPSQEDNLLPIGAESHLVVPVAGADLAPVVEVDTLVNNPEVQVDTLVDKPEVIMATLVNKPEVNIATTMAEVDILGNIPDMGSMGKSPSHFSGHPGSTDPYGNIRKNS